MKTASDIRLTSCMQHSMLQILCGLLLRLWIQRGACSVPADVFTWNSSSGFGIANAAPAAAHRIWRSYVGAARSGHEPDGKLGLKWPQNTCCQSSMAVVTRAGQDAEKSTVEPWKVKLSDGV
uniref:HDC03333 n=1 Tax=Drosophila melanogaster TaxID=7227 RepID=Q6IH50_DROME|nr:TPA_inf: HDC03333 [Drosophila melanogaster]